MSLKVIIKLRVEGNPTAAQFADTVALALPDNDFLHNMRQASIPAILPIQYRIGRNATITIDDA